MAHFDDAQLNFFHRKIVVRTRVKAIQNFGRELNPRALAGHGKFLTASRDRDVECRLDLTNIGVHRAAQRGQSVIINGRKGEF